MTDTDTDGLTAFEASKVLDRPDTVLAKWRFLDIGPEYRVEMVGGRRRIRYSRAALLAWLDAQDEKERQARASRESVRATLTQV